MFNLMWEQLRSFCFKPAVLVMMTIMSVMTLTFSQSIYLTSICIVFMLCFSQLGPQTCPAIPYEQKRYVCSRYLVYFVLVHAALAYLTLLVYVGGFLSPWQAGLTPTVWTVLTLAYIGDLTFISFAVPLSLAANRGVARLLVLMLLIVLATVMLELRGLMPLLPADFLNHCSLLLLMAFEIFLISLVTFTRQLSAEGSQESAARQLTSEEAPQH